MLDKFREITTVAKKTASNAAGGVIDNMKIGVDSLSNAATALSDSINDKAVRASTAQMCTILEIAIEELKTRPLSARPVTLTSIVNIGVASLEMQIHLLPSDIDKP
jgi:hypothetical protein